MDYISSIDDDDLKDAAYLLQLVCRPSFTTSNAIYAVSSDKPKAKSEVNINIVDTLVFSLTTSGTIPVLSLKEKCYEIHKLVEKLPNLMITEDGLSIKKDLATVEFKDFRNKRLPDIFRLINLPDCYMISGQKYYRGIYRYIEAQEKEDERQCKQQEQGGLSSFHTTTTIPNRPAPVSIISPRSSFADSISPISCSLQSQQTPGFASVSPSGSPSEQHHCHESSRKSSLSSSSMAEFLKKSSLPETRISSKQKQDERMRNLSYNDTYSSAYKVGSQMLKHQMDGRLPLDKFDAKTVKKKAVLIACAVNEMYGIDVLGGGEIRRCVEEDRVGQSPKRRGAKTRIPADEEAAIVSLVLTAQSLEQINCDPNTRDRPRMRMDIMEILNAKLAKDGKDLLNETKYYERIERELSRDISLTTTCKRDALRTLWCTHGNQEMDYKTFEEAIVDLEFGRWTTTDDEREKFGNIILHPGQVRVDSCYIASTFNHISN